MTVFLVFFVSQCRLLQLFLQYELPNNYLRSRHVKSESKEEAVREKELLRPTQ